MSPTINVTVPVDLVKRVRDTFPARVNSYIRTVGRLVQARLPELLEGELGRYQTGQLANSGVVWISTSGIEIRIGEGLPQADYVFSGVAPHIMDNTGKGNPMRWDHVGGSGIAWKVNHPGQAARTDIIEAIKALALQIFVEEFLIFDLLSGGTI